MGQMKCGCELAFEAQKIADPRGRAAQLIGAAELKKSWGCTGPGGCEPEKPPTPHAREALEAVARITGIKGFRTCPRWYAMQPGAIAVAEAYDFLREGGLESRFGRDPPHALVEATQLVRRAYNARREDEEERDKKK